MEYEYPILDPRNSIEYVKHDGYPPFNTEGWWCAYVKLPDITKEDYPYETYREGNKVGLDTNHIWNEGMSIDQRRAVAEEEIMEVIEEHERRIESVKGIAMFQEFIKKYGTHEVSKMMRSAYMNIPEAENIADELEEMLTALMEALWAEPRAYYISGE